MSSDSPARPNILCIISDEHDPAVTGCYGDDTVETPHFDRLAADGITFDDCYTTSPLCSPARLSFTAGQYVSRCGAWSNQSMLPADDYPTVARALSAAGYETLLGGRMHYDATRRYGFTELFDTEWNRSVKNGTATRRDPEDTELNHDQWHSRSSDFYIGSDTTYIQRDRRTTRECATFLRERGPDEDPFFLLAGYISPHFPIVAPFEYYEKYHGDVPMPELPDGLLDELPTNYVQLRRAFGIEGVENDRDKVRFGRELYWAYVDWFDDLVGRLLGALEDSAVAENTVVVYTSDHGENAGEHGLWWKNCMYEHGARVPLIVSWPERWAGGQRRTGACSLVDLTRTIADIAGADPHPGWDGDSMLDWMDDPDTEWKDRAVSEYYGHFTASGFAMLRSGRYKYVYHTRIDEEHGPEEELYDLATDPEESTNLADSDAHQQRTREMYDRLVEELGEDPDAIEQRAREAVSEPLDRDVE